MLDDVMVVEKCAVGALEVDTVLCLVYSEMPAKALQKLSNFFSAYPNTGGKVCTNSCKKITEIM